MHKLDDYRNIVDAPAIEELRRMAAPLAGRRIKMVNSTANGGGVAEMLRRLVPLLNDLGIAAAWEVMKGDEQFFRITKKFHHALQGGHCDAISEGELEFFLEVNRANLGLLDDDEDFVVVHDPQPVALIEARARAPQSRWIWRCHIDLAQPEPSLWRFLRPVVERYDGAIFSSPTFCQELATPQHIFYPSIDPLADKNRELPEAAIDEALRRLGVPRDKPIVTQVSRFDYLKDPLGVIRAFKMARRDVDCRLVLAGGAADDDPEGQAVLREARKAAGADPDIHILGDRHYDALEINALVRGSALVVQKSVKEGFGLTVAEALWKRKPVIASPAGGLPLQVQHDSTGVIVWSAEETAAQIRALLADPARMQALGDAGHERVRREFLITSNVRRWLTLLGESAESQLGETPARRAGAAA